MTDVVVLAAGLGRRLAGVAQVPKWLIPVNGSCPADAHLEAFAAAGLGRIHVVVPPDREAIERHVGPWMDRLALELVPNPHAADRNNWYSLLLGLDAWGTRSGTDVVVVNSDLFARPRWFTALVDEITGTGRPAALAVDRARGRTDEAMKVELDASGDAIGAIGKVGIARPGGEYVGLAWWARDAAEELRAVLATFLDQPSRVDNWYEHGIQQHLEAGAEYGVADVPSSDWVEIDDEDDLEAARMLPGG